MEAPPTSGSRLPSGLRRAGVLVVVASFVGIWGYVMYLSVFEGRAEPRDRLDDTDWTEAAEATCAEFTDDFADLQLASEVDSPEERADLLDAGTAISARLVDRVGGLVEPGPADEAAAVERWLADYRVYLDDRRAYADAQRDPAHPRYDEPFTVTDRGGFQIDVLVDDFAKVNDMTSCETPDDV